MNSCLLISVYISKYLKLCMVASFAQIWSHVAIPLGLSSVIIN